MKELQPHEIRLLRRELGWTQAEMGNYLGYRQGSVNSWEHGTKPPRPVMEVLVEMRKKLDKKNEEKKQQFAEGLAIAAGAGFIALVAYLINEENND